MTSLPSTSLQIGNEQFDDRNNGFEQSNDQSNGRTHGQIPFYDDSMSFNQSNRLSNDQSSNQSNDQSNTQTSNNPSRQSSNSSFDEAPSDSDEGDKPDPHSPNDQSNSTGQVMSAAESATARKRRHAQIDASRRARETAIIEQLKTLSGQRAECVKRDRLESLEVAVERYKTLTLELPRLQRLVLRLTQAAQQQHLIDPSVDPESWLAEADRLYGSSPSLLEPARAQLLIDSPSSSVPSRSNTRSPIQPTPATMLNETIAEEDALMYLVAFSDLIRSHPFHSMRNQNNFISSTVPLCAIRLRDARMTACNSAMLTRLQWRHEPQDIVRLQCVDLWFILADIYRRVVTIPFAPLDNNGLLIQSTGVISHANRTDPVVPLISQPQSVVNEIIRLLSGLTDVIDVELLAPAAANVAQKRRCRVWLTKGWQTMQISDVEMIFHLISVSVGPVDSHLLHPKGPESSY